MVTLRLNYRFGGYGARQWRPATDQPLVSSKQSLSPGTVPGLFSLSANAGCWHYLAKT